MVTQILEWRNRSRRSNSNDLDNVQKQLKRVCSENLLIINRISSRTYFNKYSDIYRYSRNSTFFFLFKLLHFFLYKPKYLPSYLYSCKILFFRLMKNKKDLLKDFLVFFLYMYIYIYVVFFVILLDVHTLRLEASW